jgi:hypothetical protein
MNNYFEKNDEELLREERWRFTSRRSSMKSEEEKFESIVGSKHQKINSTFTPIGRVDSRIRWFLAIASEVEDIWSRRLKKSKEIEVWRSRRLNRSFQEVKDWRNRSFQEVEDWRNQRLKNLRIEEVKDLKFGDSTRVCDSSRVSGATDMDMPFGYTWISIPGLAHYGSGQAQGLEDWLGDEEERF